MSHRRHLIAIVFFIVVVTGLGFGFLPKFWAKAVPGYLSEHIGSSVLKIEKAKFLYSPPRLILSDVHLVNPPQFGSGDAVHIGTVEVLFEDYHYTHMMIQSVTASDVHGRLVTRGMDDNFATLFNVLMAKKQEVPRGEMARDAKLEKVLTRQVTIQNEDGSVTLPLEDSELQPIATLAAPAPLQNIVVDVLGAIIGQQAQSGPALVVKGATNKAVDTIKSIGKAVSDFISSPAKEEKK